jgi:hypothetical protein
VNLRDRTLILSQPQTTLGITSRRIHSNEAGTFSRLVDRLRVCSITESSLKGLTWIRQRWDLMRNFQSPTNRVTMQVSIIGGLAKESILSFFPASTYTSPYIASASLPPIPAPAPYSPPSQPSLMRATQVYQPPPNIPIPSQYVQNTSGKAVLELTGDLTAMAKGW